MVVAARTSTRTRAKSAPAAAPRGIARTKESWQAKLRPDAKPKVVKDPKAGDRLLVATPLLVAEELSRVPRGHVITVGELRARLARRQRADRTCPLTTGIFAAIVAGVVSEDLLRGRKARWPIWRLVRDDGTLHGNWPLDARFRASQLRAEGQHVTRHGQTWKVLRGRSGRS